MNATPTHSPSAKTSLAQASPSRTSPTPAASTATPSIGTGSINGLPERGPLTPSTPQGARRRFIAATMVDALGNGLYVPFSLLFFHNLTGLSLLSVGAGMTAAGFIGLLLTPVVGILIDKIGARTILQAGFALRLVAFAAFPFVSGFAPFLIVSIAVAIGQQSAAPSQTALVAEMTEGAGRDKLLALNRSVINGSMGVAGVLAGVLMAFSGDTAYVVMAVANAASFGAAAVLIHGLGKVRTRRGADIAQPTRHTAQAAAPEPATPGSATAPASDPVSGPRPKSTPEPGFRVVLKDRPYLGITAANLLIALSYVAMAAGMPIYLTRDLNVPQAMSGMVFAINTAMVAILGVPVARLVLRARRTRAAALGAAVFAGSFVLFAGLQLLHTGVVAGVLVAAVIYTGAELIHSAPAQGISVQTPPDHLRGRYLATYQLSWSIARAVAPLLITFLLGLGSWQLWAGLGAAALLGALLLIRLERILPAEAVHPVSYVKAA